MLWIRITLVRTQMRIRIRLSPWCGSGFWFLFMRVRIWIFIWCDFSPWCGSGYRSYRSFQIKTLALEKVLRNQFTLWYGSWFLFDADTDPDADPGYQNDADPDTDPDPQHWNKNLGLNPDPKHCFEVRHVPGNGLRQLVRIFRRGMPTADDVAVPG